MNIEWSQVAGLSPRLRDAVRINRHHYRGCRWYILRDGVTGRWQRINEPAYRLLRLLEGRCDLATARAAAGDAIISETEAIAVLDALNRAELLDWGVVDDVDAMLERATAAQRRKRLSQLMSPFSIRIRLFDPDRLLSRQLPLATTLFSLAGLGVAMAIIALGALLAFVDWHNITGYWDARGLTASSFVLIPLVYIVIKTVHEFAHGLAAKRWGGEVHDVGIVFLLLIPIPYVDASSAWAFPEKHRRIIVGAAGIAAELVLAGLAMIVFFTVEVGIVKDVAYTTMLLGSVSTLLFNGNPLLRFDGYYVLADAIEIPNLGSRSTRYWGYLIQRYVFGIHEMRSPVTAGGERGWFFCYGAAASLYRIAIIVGIALFVASELPVIGIALAVWALISQIGVPVARHAHFVLCGSLLAGRRARAVTIVGGSLAGAAVALLAIPMPLSTYAEGVVWLPESAHIRAGADGTVNEIMIGSDQAVAVGAPVMRIGNPLLDTHIAALQWELKEAEARYSAARVTDRVETQVLSEAIGRLREDLVSARAEVESLVVTSPADGTLVIPKSTHLAGRFVSKGDVLGYVLESTSPTVRTAIPQTLIGTLRRGVNTAKVRLAEDPRTTLHAEISRETPAATRRLPSVALGTLAGGMIPVDPSDSSGLSAIDRLYVVDLRLSDAPPSPRVGGRVHVRFEHDAEPVGFRLYRALRQLLLARLAV